MYSLLNISLYINVDKFARILYRKWINLKDLDYIIKILSLDCLFLKKKKDHCNVKSVVYGVYMCVCVWGGGARERTNVRCVCVRAYVCVCVCRTRAHVYEWK